MSSLITISGLPGSGTTTLCKLLKSKTGLKYVYAGQLFRNEAEQRGMTLAEFGELCQTDSAVDQALDARQEALLKESKELILEGRLSGWLAEMMNSSALKVWVNCDEMERRRRIVDRDGGDEDDQAAKTLAREASEADRYQRYYSIDLADMSPYDLVLDSTHKSPEELADIVLAALRSD